MKHTRCLSSLLALLILCSVLFSVAGNTCLAEENDPAEPAARLISDEEIDSGKYDPFYANTLFFGDSLIKSFNNYGYTHKVDGKFLGGATFVFKVGIPVRFSLTSWLSFRGNNVRIMDIVNMLEIDRIVIFLGVNDNAGIYHAATLGHFSDLIDAIHEAKPDVEIVILALIPLAQSYCKKCGYSIDKWNSFNVGLRKLCVEKGVGYLDFTGSLKNDNGYLDKSMCGDNKYHLTAKGNDVFLRSVRVYAMLRTEENAAYAGETLLDIVLPKDAAPVQ